MMLFNNDYDEDYSDDDADKNDSDGADNGGDDYKSLRISCWYWF